MRSTVRSYQAAVVLLTAALLATLTVALTGGDRADAVDGPVDVVYVATGRNFPDALAGATLATSANAPMLTVNTSLPIPPDTVTALEALDPDRIIIFGGSAAVSDDIATALASYARSGEVSRIEGDDRHGTAAAIADALPDKVADADLLDGLDSTDFLRTGDADQFAPSAHNHDGRYLRPGDSIDADTLDGIDGDELLTEERRLRRLSANSTSQSLAAPPAWTTLTSTVATFPDDCDPGSDTPVGTWVIDVTAQAQVNHSASGATTELGIRVGTDGDPSSGNIRTVQTSAGFQVPVTINTAFVAFEDSTLTIELVGRSENEFVEVDLARLVVRTADFGCGTGPG